MRCVIRCVIIELGGWKYEETLESDACLTCHGMFTAAYVAALEAEERKKPPVELGELPATAICGASKE